MLVLINENESLINCNEQLMHELNNIKTQREIESEINQQNLQVRRGRYCTYSTLE